MAAVASHFDRLPDPGPVYQMLPMGLGLYLYGDVTRPRDALLEELRAFAREAHGGVVLGSRIGEGDGGHRTLWLSLHPAEEDVELRALGSGKLLASARTSGAGPGYHAFVCELLDQVAERFNVSWQGIDPTSETGDETGWFHHRDRPRLEAEMRGWLRGVATSLCARAGDGWEGIAVSMPAGAPLYDVPGAATALGPRDAAFWRRVAEDDAAAEQFFPWWEPGTGAGYLLGRALCRMWSDVYWREPLNDVETRVHADVLDTLERGFALDPARAWPLAEWAELAQYNSRPLPAGASSAAGTPPTIGYRRGTLVTQPFPGVSVRLPGSFSEGYDKRGWSAWGEGRTVWLSLLAANKRPGVTVPVDQPEPTRDETEEGGARVHRLRGKREEESGDEVRVLMVTIVFAEDA